MAKEPTPSLPRRSLYRKAEPAGDSIIDPPRNTKARNTTRVTPPDAAVPPVEARQTRKADRHKEGQAAYMREYRAKKKAEKDAESAPKA